jgi:hypothetical protein
LLPNTTSIVIFTPITPIALFILITPIIFIHITPIGLFVLITPVIVTICIPPIAIGVMVTVSIWVLIIGL